MAPQPRFNDQTSPTSTDRQPHLSTNLMDEVINERLKVLPNMPARPGDPHYVGQSIYDATSGMLDLNSGKFCQGETEINNSIKDLATEQKLIGGAQADGKTAAQDILNGDTQGAEAALTKTIGDLKGNYFNTADRNQYQKALDDLKKGDTWGAEEDIAKAEKILGNRSDRVTDASKNLTQGLKDFNSGKFGEGEKDMHQAMADLHLHKKGHGHGHGHGHGTPPDIFTMPMTSADTSLEVPNPTSLYTNA